MRTRDVAELIPCRKCGGAGGAVTQHYNLLTPFSPDERLIPCPRCEGTGEEPCSYCGGAPAVATYDGDAICAACAVIVARESEKAA